MNGANRGKSAPFNPGMSAAAGGLSTIKDDAPLLSITEMKDIASEGKYGGLWGGSLDMATSETKKAINERMLSSANERGIDTSGMMGFGGQPLGVGRVGAEEYMGMIEKGAEQLDPYRQAGLQGLEQLQAGGFGQDQFQYGGDTAQFQYDGQTPGFNYQSNIPGMQYGGQAVSDIGYQGQQPGQFQYGGSPESRSIQSFMGDITQDPGYQFRLEEGQKAIDRASAASGRFGGGRTAKELMRFGQGLASQEYGAAYGRAGQERDAQMQAEQQQYGRGLTGYGLEAAREQQGYGRAVTGAQFARAGEQDQYGRALTDVGLGRDAEQQMYGRALTGDQRALGLEEQAYGRAVGDFERELGAEQLQYGRAVGEYGMEGDRLGQEYGRAQNLAGIGERAATATGGMYSGLGSQLMGQTFQQQQNMIDAARQKDLLRSQEESDMFSDISGIVGKGLSAYMGGS